MRKFKHNAPDNKVAITIMLNFILVKKNTIVDGL